MNLIMIIAQMVLIPTAGEKFDDFESNNILVGIIEVCIEDPNRIEKSENDFEAD